jgi:hypothetical protein
MFARIPFTTFRSTPHTPYYLIISISFCCFHLEHRASVKCFVSLQFLNLKTIGRTPWMGDQPAARLLPTQTQNKRTQTSMSCVGFEPTIPAFERAKTVHALDRSATAIGNIISFVF